MNVSRGTIDGLSKQLRENPDENQISLQVGSGMHRKLPVGELVEYGIFVVLKEFPKKE